KKLLAIPTIVVGVFYGIKIMIIGMLVYTVATYYLNSYWSGKLIQYPISEQLKDIIPSLILALIVSSVVFLIGIFIDMSDYAKLTIQSISGIILFFIIA